MCVELVEWMSSDSAGMQFPAIGVSLRNGMDRGEGGPGNFDTEGINKQKLLSLVADIDLGPYS